MVRQNRLPLHDFQTYPAYELTNYESGEECFHNFDARKTPAIDMG